MRRNVSLLLSAMACAAVSLSLGGIVSASSPSLEDKTEGIARELRCPVCQNLSVADSPSELATQMRGLIRDKLQRGESREQIIAYFVEKYGEWILLSPARRGFNWLVWIAPFAGLLGGLGIMGGILYRWRERRSPPPSPAERDPVYSARLRAELDEERDILP